MSPKEQQRRYRLRQKLLREWKEIPEELKVMQRPKLNPTEREKRSAELCKKYREERHARKYVSIESVIEQYWRQHVADDYIILRLHDFLRKYKVYREDARREFWLKTSREEIDRARSYQKDTTTLNENIREEFLAKTWAINKVINDNYKYEPIYTHKPSVQLPIIVETTKPTAKDFLKNMTNAQLPT